MPVQRGFTYVGLLLIIAVISLIATASVQVGAIVQRRQAEDQLLFVGLAYKHAIRSYFEAAPPNTVATAPTRLEDLIRDPRFPGIKRHIRQLYDDPVTGRSDWTLIRASDGKGILGVRSASRETPIRMDHFQDELFHFKGRKRYADWVFVYGVVCTDAGCELDPAYNEPNHD